MKDAQAIQMQLSLIDFISSLKAGRPLVGKKVVYDGIEDKCSPDYDCCFTMTSSFLMISSPAYFFGNMNSCNVLEDLSIYEKIILLIFKSPKVITNLPPIECFSEISQLLLPCSGQFSYPHISLIISSVMLCKEKQQKINSPIPL